MNRSPIRHAAVALGLVCAALVALGPTASAHEGEGVLTVESQGTADAGSVPYAVRLTWADDGHPAVDATITATAIDPGGTSQTPVVMQPEGGDGRYTATVAFPSAGTWTVRFTAVTPAATAEIVEEVAAPPGATSSTTTTTGAPVDAGAPDAEPAGAAEVQDGGDGGSGGLLVAAAIAVVVALAAAAVIRARRTRGTR